MKKIILSLFVCAAAFTTNAQSTSVKQNEVTYSELKREPVAQDEFTKNYNTGIGYYNRAVKQVQKAGQVAAEPLEHFKTAKPYLEKALQLKPSSKNAMTALAGIYYATNDMVNYNKMKESLAAAK